MSSKLFLGGLPATCSTDALKEYFGNFGTVTDAIFFDGRGFGFVTYDNPETAQEVMNQPHEIDGKPCDIRLADGNKGSGKGGKGGAKGKGGFGGGWGGAGAWGGAGGGYGGPGAYAAGGSGKGKGGGKGQKTDKIF